MLTLTLLFVMCPLPSDSATSSFFTWSSISLHTIQLICLVFGEVEVQSTALCSNRHLRWFCLVSFHGVKWILVRVGKGLESYLTFLWKKDVVICGHSSY